MLCLANLRQIALAATQYVQENKGWLLDYNQYYTKSSWVIGTRHSNTNNGYPSALWMDVIYRYLGREIRVLECPEQTRVERSPYLDYRYFQLLLEPAPDPLNPLSPTGGRAGFRPYYPGYLQTTHTHHHAYALGPYIRLYYPGNPPGLDQVTLYRNLKHRQVKQSSEKIWYADSGRQWNGASGFEGWQPLSSRGLMDGGTTSTFGAQVSWRHGTRAGPLGNVAYFDGHAATIDPREVECRGTVYDAGGSATPQERAKWARHWDPDGDGILATPR